MSDKPDDLLSGLVLPVIAAPMFLVTGPDLVIAACKAGVMAGAAFASARSPSQYDEWLARIDEELAAHERQTGVRPGAYGANLSAGSARQERRAAFEQELDCCRRRKVKLIFTVGGAPTEIVQEAQKWGGLVFHDATTIRHAEKAAEAGVDGLTLIAGGGGGHAGSLNPFAFVQQVRKFFSGKIILGGALSTGRDVLAAQILGADFCYMGTRFIATQESMAPQAYKEMLVRCSSSEIVYTNAFTHGVPCNFMIPSIRENGYDTNNLTAEAVAQSPAFGSKKPWRDIWAAGHSVGLINDIPSVAALVARLSAEYEEAKSDLRRFVS